MSRGQYFQAIRTVVLLLTALSGTDALAITAAISINNAATCTAGTDGAVVLNNTVSNGTPSHYRASESQTGISSVTWQAYSAKPSFTLSSGAGKKTVYFQVRETRSNSTIDSAVVSDQIERVVRNDSLTLSINKGKDRTTAPLVTLNASISMTPADNSRVEYTASENPAYYPAFQTFDKYPLPQFLLSNGLGTKTVHMAVRRSICGEMHGPKPVSDSINLVMRHEFTSTTSTTVRAVESFAKDRGFTRSLTKFGTGKCGGAIDRMTADRTVEGVYFWPELTCTWSFFGGRKLNAGWKTVSVSLDNEWHGIFSKIMLPDSNDASFSVRIVLPKEISGSVYDCPVNGSATGDGCSSVTKLVIEGPSTDWRDAFK